ncbi:MAG: hypothetical protein FJX72_13040 [Armatimonadetes bacterium]|nr:hypothetical protein [Armatimonadota bacterium]
MSRSYGPCSWMSFVLLMMAAWQAVAEDGFSLELPAAPLAVISRDLEVVWRVGGEDEDGPLLGVVNTGVRRDSGEVLLLDTQLGRILVISPDGQLVRTLGREGEGPGEFRYPTGLLLDRGTDIGVVQSSPGKIVRLHADGSPAGLIQIDSDAKSGSVAHLGGAMRVGDDLVAMYGLSSIDLATAKIVTESRLVHLADDGRELACYAKHTKEQVALKFVYDEAAEFSELSIWALAPGRVYTVPRRSDYAIDVRAIDGRMLGRISRPFDTCRRSAEDRARIREFYEAALGGRMPFEANVLDHDSAIMDLDVAADGRLFVRTCRQATGQLAPGDAARYDVIDPDSDEFSELVLHLDGFEAGRDDLVFLDGEHFLHLKNIEAARAAVFAGIAGIERKGGMQDGPLEVVLCRFARR